MNLVTYGFKLRFFKKKLFFLLPHHPKKTICTGCVREEYPFYVTKMGTLCLHTLYIFDKKNILTTLQQQRPLGVFSKCMGSPIRICLLHCPCVPSRFVAPKAVTRLKRTTRPSSEREKARSFSPQETTETFGSWFKKAETQPKKNLSSLIKSYLPFKLM